METTNRVGENELYDRLNASEGPVMDVLDKLVKRRCAFCGSRLTDETCERGYCGTNPCPRLGKKQPPPVWTRASLLEEASHRPAALDEFAIGGPSGLAKHLPIQPPASPAQPKEQPVAELVQSGPPCSVCTRPIRKDNKKGAHAACLKKPKSDERELGLGRMAKKPALPERRSATRVDELPSFPSVEELDSKQLAAAREAARQFAEDCTREARRRLSELEAIVGATG